MPLPDVTGMLSVLSRFAVVEAGGVDPVGNFVHLAPPDGINGAAGGQVINHMAVSAGDDGGIVGGFGTAFDLDAIDAARAKGHKVFINTGRSWGNIPDELRAQFNVDGVIAGSGAMVIADGKTVYKIEHLKNAIILLWQK